MKIFKKIKDKIIGTEDSIESIREIMYKLSNGFNHSETIDMKYSLSALIANWLRYFVSINNVLHLKDKGWKNGLEFEPIVEHYKEGEFENILNELADTFDEYASLETEYNKLMTKKLAEIGLPEYESKEFYDVVLNENNMVVYKGKKQKAISAVSDMEIETTYEIEQKEKELLEKMKRLFDFEIFSNLYT